jgi:hypothetical protein
LKANPTFVLLLLFELVRRRNVKPTEANPAGSCRIALLLLAALVLSSVAATPSAAQVLYGSIVGNVTDAQGATVPGATVTIVSKETALTREATADEQGNYSLVNLLPGSYDVKVTIQGFREFVRSNVPVGVGEISRVDVRLEVGNLTETVTVASEAALLQTDKADTHTELRSKEIVDMPLNQFRNYQYLVNLVPGASPGSYQNAETDTPGRSLRTNVNGLNGQNNNTRSDGATNVNIWLPHHAQYVAPAETIDTVNIATSNFDAEQGQAGGAAITLVTKSGTNEFRGSLFEFYNSDALNASPYFFGRAASKPEKLPVTQNIFGGTLGGPIRRNRLFFFGSMEAYKRSQNQFSTFNVPNEALRSGDFSQARNTDGSLQVIYDPLTGNPDGTGRQPFANNQIPANRINRIARQLLDLYPLPNSGGIGAGNLTNNYLRDDKITNDRYNWDSKVNWNRTSSHQIWGKFSYMDAVVDDLGRLYLGPDPNAEGDGGVTKVYQFTVGQTWTLGPTVVLDSTFGFGRQDQDNLGPDFQAGNFGLDVLGIPGTNDQGIGDDRYAGYPQFDTGFSALGNISTWVPAFRDERTYSFTTNVTKVYGAHEFRGGYLLNFLYLDHWQPELGLNPRGAFQFNANTTALRGGAQTGNFYNQWAAFLLGLTGGPTAVGKAVQYELMTGREWQHGLYFRDRWTVSPKITLDLGLRWEYYPIMHRADRGLERVDLETFDVLLGGRGGNPDNVGLEASKNHFAPRLGMVYRLDEQSVFRAGYGVTFNPLPWARPLRGFYPLTISSAFFNPETFGFYNSLEQGIPLIVGPDLSSGRFRLPNNYDMRTPEPGNVERGAIHSWNLAYERRLPLDVSVDVAYVGTRGNDGYADLDINASDTPGGGTASRAFFPQFGRGISLLSWGARTKSRYHSLQLGVNRPFTKGLLLKGAYTWSKAMNEADDDGWVGLTWNGASQLHRNYALAGYDRTHNFQMGFVYALPWQTNGDTGVVRAVINDWQLNGVFAAFSGNPFTVVADGAVLNMPGNQQTADQVGEIQHVGEIGGSGPYYDPSAWVQPQGVRLGDSGRNSVRGPGGVNLDVSLFRGFPLGGTRRLELRIQATNLTNTPKFANPTDANRNVNSPTFMVITQTHNLYVQRQVQIGLRFQF